MQLHLGLADWTHEHGVEQDLVTAYARLRCADPARVPYPGYPLAPIDQEMTEQEVQQGLGKADEFRRGRCSNCL